MANGESQTPRTNRPLDGEKPSPMGYTLNVGFHPDMRLDKRDAGFEFARQLASLIDPQSAQIDANMWTFSQPLGSASGAGLFVRVAANSIQFDLVQPTESREWIERRAELILSELGKQFKPKLILGTSATIRATLQIDGDARRFIGQHVMKIDEAHCRLLKRPIHLFGLRLFLPAFSVQAIPQKGRRKPKEQVTNWQVNLRAESLLDDPTKVFLEAEASWPEPKQWDTDSTTEAVRRLETISAYLENDVLEFLRTCSQEEQK
jgi:hypothetical protein